MNDEVSNEIDSTVREKNAGVEKVPEKKWRRRFNRLAWRVHARFPNTVPNPYRREKESIRKRDAQANLESSLKEGENLQLGCIVVSEIFGPNEIEALYEDLIKIGWGKDRISTLTDVNIEWIKEQRLYGHGGWLSLGHVVRPREVKDFLGVCYTADFPIEFSSLWVRLTQLTPSVTCMTVAFMLSDEASRDYLHEINRPAETRYSPNRRTGGYAVQGVEVEKETRVGLVREKYRNLGIAWFAKNFPGFFTKHCEDTRFPTAEFLSLDGFTPFEHDTEIKRGWRHWSRFVGIGRSSDFWLNNENPSLGYAMRNGYQETLPNHITVAQRWEASSEPNEEVVEISLNRKAMTALNELEGIIPHYAFTAYLSELLRDLKETRQSFATVSKARRSTQDVDRISSFFRRFVGIPAVAQEALALAKDEVSFRINASGFSYHSGFGADKKLESADGLRSFTERLSRKLLEDDRGTREFLNQMSSAIGTKENIAAQRRMEFLAVVAAIVSFGSLIVASIAIGK
ncbi:hypothetical protein [Aliiroseovarius halocynthiae]|uniref:Uncharacterized protein n=1 Tax=Aliiroseovarius halocynthiae TaxID=985055 RepID=A0A545SR80_9RHOB|nr:hypothetical protein [Aliiroseovarius halocynthiae]TQV67481.1 hypothetical protein FIL88_09660 [Aliiroseovarius halocynthiae]